MTMTLRDIRQAEETVKRREKALADLPAEAPVQQRKMLENLLGAARTILAIREASYVSPERMRRPFTV